MLFRRLAVIAILSAFTYAFASHPAPTPHSAAPERPEALVGPQNGIWEAGPDLETGVPEAIYQARLAEEARVEAERIAAEAETARIAAARQVQAQIHIGTPLLVQPTVRAQMGCAYDGLIRSVFVEDPDWAVAIAMRESGCQPTARNPSGASGLFQMMMPMHTASFNAVGCTADQWPDPVCNVNAAHLLYLGSGRAPWNL